MFWCPAVSSPCPAEGWSLVCSEFGLSEPSLSPQRVNRKMQGTREQGEAKRLQHPLQTAASPRSLGCEGWEERGKADFWLHCYCRLPGPRNSVRACKPYKSSPGWVDTHTRDKTQQQHLQQINKDIDRRDRHIKKSLTFFHRRGGKIKNQKTNETKPNQKAQYCLTRKKIK